jgi:hypothetical protein
VSSDLSAWRRRLEPLTDPVIAALVLLLSVVPLVQADQCDTVAAYAERRLAHAAAVIAVVGIVVVYPLDWPVSHVEDITVTSLILLTAWLLG